MLSFCFIQFLILILTIKNYFVYKKLVKSDLTFFSLGKTHRLLLLTINHK